jgi:hypothetical protein
MTAQHALSFAGRRLQLNTGISAPNGNQGTSLKLGKAGWDSKESQFWLPVHELRFTKNAKISTIHGWFIYQASAKLFNGANHSALKAKHDL